MKCSICGKENAIVNQCHCDPNNLPTQIPRVPNRPLGNQPSIQLTFKDDDDLLSFIRYWDKAKQQDGTVTGLYCGLMCSALKRSAIAGSHPVSVAMAEANKSFDAHLEQAINDIAFAAGLELARNIRTLADKLTDDERKRFSHKYEFPMRLAKSLLCACETDTAINSQFASEATLKEIKALRRIGKNRVV